MILRYAPSKIIRARWHVVSTECSEYYISPVLHVFVCPCARALSFDPTVCNTGERISLCHHWAHPSAAKSIVYQHRTCYFMFLVVFTHIFLPLSLHYVPLVRHIVNEIQWLRIESKRDSVLLNDIEAREWKKNILPACVYNRSSTRFSVIFIHFFLLFGIFGQAHLVLPRCHYHLLISIDSCVKEFVQLYYHLMMCAWMKIPTTSK